MILFTQKVYLPSILLSHVKQEPSIPPAHLSKRENLRDRVLRNCTHTYTELHSLRKLTFVTPCWICWGGKALDNSTESHPAMWSQNQFATHRANRNDEIYFANWSESIWVLEALRLGLSSQILKRKLDSSAAHQSVQLCAGLKGRNTAWQWKMQFAE